MIFNSPKSFTEALESRQVKALLPTDARTSELRQIAPELRERAMFSARTESARVLGRYDSMINQVLDPEYVVDPETGERRPRGPGEYMSPAKARQLIRKELAAIGYTPESIGATRGGIADLASDARIDLVMDTNTQMARGYGQWQQGQDTSILDMWPAQELVRTESREEPRTGSGGGSESSYWSELWVRSGGTLYEGRMVARKNDPIWIRISRFDLPYEPFDFNSGMGLVDVTRREAMRLGVIDRDETIEPQERPFNEDLEMDLPVDRNKQPDLHQALLEDLGDKARLVNGVLRFVQEVS